MSQNYTILQGDCLDVLKTLPDESVQCCITSPPYWGLRDYGMDSQIGLESTPDEFASKLADVFDEVKRVLKPSGTLWLNLGDSYSGGGRGCDTAKQQTNRGTRDMPKSIVPEGLKQKDLVGIPWLVAFELRRRGWWLRQEIIWAKPNPMPESVTDRCTKSHESIFLLTKRADYYFDHVAIQEQANYEMPKFEGDAQIKMPDIDVETCKASMPVFGNHSLPECSPFKAPSELPNTKGRDRSLPRNRNGITGTLDRKYVGTEYGGNGTGFQDHSGYSNLENPVIRNKRDVWSVNVKPFTDAHFATFPEDLIRPMVLAGTKEGDMILDPFNGAGTTGAVAVKNRRQYIGIELNPKYIEIAEKRLNNVHPTLFA